MNDLNIEKIKAAAQAVINAATVSDGFNSVAKYMDAENCFKVIAGTLKEEMISCPGDSKLKHISEISDYSLKISPSAELLQYYVNGDCSKLVS